MGNNSMKKEKKKIIAVSGAFDPLHPGHIRLFREAKKLGEELVVVLNNDNWLKKKKGYVFMPEKERKEVIEAIKWVDRVVLTNHFSAPADMSICAELEKIHPQIFARGGSQSEDYIPELKFCKKIGCRVIFNVGRGGKIGSSSKIVANFAKEI